MTKRKHSFDAGELAQHALDRYANDTEQKNVPIINQALSILEEVGPLSFMRVCLPDDDDMYYCIETPEYVNVYAARVSGYVRKYVYSRFQFGVMFTHHHKDVIYHRDCKKPEGASLR